MKQFAREIFGWPDFGGLRQNLAPLVASALLFGIVVGAFVAVLIFTKP